MNKITKIFNNIGFYCFLNNDIFIDTGAIKSYQSLDHTSVGYYIPYLVRNIKDNVKWEIGVGEVIWLDSKVCVKRYEISSSSNKDQKVNFTGNENEFYLFVNNSNFNSSFNNVILKNDHFNIDNITSIYLVDNSVKTIDCVLPQPNDARNVVVDIKALTDNNNVKIRLYNGEILGSTNDSIRLVSDGQSWYIMNNLDSTVNFGQLSGTDSFNMLSSPSGDDYSFQYKNGEALAGSNLYWSSGDSNKLLLGSDSEVEAHTIIPTSGSEPTIFNKDLQASDFIVYGSGQSYRNLFFSYDGRIGVNIPSGSRPQTIFHVVNYSCSEILRLENRTSCQPAKLTLYHKPSFLTNGSTCSILNLAGRDTVGNQKDYASISSVAKDINLGYGGLVLSVLSGSSQQTLVSGDNNTVRFGYDDNKRLEINNNGSVSLSGSTIDLRGSSSAIIGNSTNNISFANGITLSQTSLNLGNGNITANGNIQSNGQITASNGIVLPSIAPSSLLTLDSNRKIVPISGVTINSTGIALNNIESNKLLSLDDNKNIVGLYDLNDYFLTERDIVWNKYSARNATVCLKQIIFDEETPSAEFSIGDQIEIETDAGLLYRIITDIVYNNNNIVELLLDQAVTTNVINNVTLKSITKGGYLLMQKRAEEGTSDSTSNILSIRPLTDTVFNTAQKDINFVVYGTDEAPALKIYANLGSVNRPSGIYHTFATQSDSISPILVNSAGIGISNNFSTANFNSNPIDNLFAAQVSDVGSNGKSSFYKTYDQNGNVSEWLESSVLEDVVPSQQLAAGGSYLSNSTNLLRNVQNLATTGFYPDVGFRLASLVNIVDNFNSNININFVTVEHANNIADTSDLNIDGLENSISNLGVVNKNYRISTYEVTNNQYATFLNSVATGVTNPIVSELYHPEMSGTFGGINRISSDSEYQYTTKNNMANKPVNYVSYINSLRFVNWLENGAPSFVDPVNIDQVINKGSYEILLAGNNYYVETNLNRKYFLPSLNQWHKAAYFEYKESVLISGSPVVTINTDAPDVVAVEKISSLGALSVEEQTPRRVISNLTVNGWLVVDKIVVRNHSGPGRAFRSSLSDIGFEPERPTSDGGGGQSDPDPQKPPSPDDDEGFRGDNIWEDVTSQPDAGRVYGEREPPLVVNIDPTSEVSCDDDELKENDNLPYWCSDQGKFNGPSFY